MTKSEKENILFHINDKANTATQAQYNAELKGKLYLREFYQGQYMAFNEMYSFITNIHTNDE